MKYFIKLNGDKVIEWRKGVFTPNDAKQITKEGFIEVENGELLNGDTPLIYRDGLLTVNDAEVKNLEQMQELRKEMDALSSELLNTDYVVIKIAEGVATAEEYADILKKRAEWRKRINEIEEALYNG